MSKEYLKRTLKILEFITLNLDRELNLSILANEAHYSPFHFHRIFTAITGETPNQYILRKRIERAAYQLKTDKELSVLEISLNSGFESQSSFAKAFKRHYGVTPTFLKENSNEFSKIRQINSKNGQRQIEISQDFCDIKKLIDMTNSSEIELKEMPAMQVAYVTHIGPFDQIGKAYGKLMSWAGPKGLVGGKTITCYHDNPEVTDISQIRQSACIEIKKEAQASGMVNITTIESGQYAVGRFEVSFQEFEKAWQTMMVWVSEHGYQPNEKRACYEIYHNNFKNHPQQKSIIEICVPVKLEA